MNITKRQSIIYTINGIAIGVIITTMMVVGLVNWPNIEKRLIKAGVITVETVYTDSGKGPTNPQDNKAKLDLGDYNTPKTVNRLREECREKYDETNKINRLTKENGFPSELKSGEKLAEECSVFLKLNSLDRSCFNPQELETVSKSIKVCSNNTM